MHNHPIPSLTHSRVTQILAEMHLENYAPQEPAEAAHEEEVAGTNVVVDETSSRFVAAFQAAVAGLKKHHLSRFPTQAEFAIRGLQWLAGRCVLLLRLLRCAC